ncbi:MAG: AAA-like domain-containing protein [Bacteroidia bacterium]|nr:AAA-like domain-containing protein [Bacteroidia bacterium]
MPKSFNTTGLCLPDQHYMCDVSAKLAITQRMAEQGKYFVIHRPRQYGKTTLLHLLEASLSRLGYLSVSISFEGMGTDVFEDESAFCSGFLRQIAQVIEQDHPAVSGYIQEHLPGIHQIHQLSAFIGQWVQTSQANIVLLIDEVDKSSNHTLFIEFLGMLRTRYLGRTRLPTFHAVILAGLHDIKSLKLRMRADSDTQYNSPWNIAAEYEVDLTFSPAEIAPMLADYAQTEDITIDIPWYSQQIHYYSGGYPYLVSRICQVIAEKLLGTGRVWTPEMLEEAIKYILGESSTLFDSLIEKLENNPALAQLTHKMLLDGQTVSFNRDNPTIHLGMLFGLYRKDADQLRLHNRIHEQRIYNYLASKAETDGGSGSFFAPATFYLPDGRLDFRRVLEKFRLFMQEQHSLRDQKFLERDGRLVFLAFIAPIINGGGFSFKEAQISEERRIDVTVTFGGEKFVVELKVWRGPAAHQTGLDQLADYLGRQHLDSGYLLIFNHPEGAAFQPQLLMHQDKSLWVVGV